MDSKSLSPPDRVLTHISNFEKRFPGIERDGDGSEGDFVFKHFGWPHAYQCKFFFEIYQQ